MLPCSLLPRPHDFPESTKSVTIPGICTQVAGKKSTWQLRGLPWTLSELKLHSTVARSSWRFQGLISLCVQFFYFFTIMTYCMC